MTLLVPGHPYAYEMENVLRLFYPGEKIAVRTEGDPAAADTVTTRAELLPDGSRRLSVTLGGGDAACTLEPGTGEDEAEQALARMLFGLLDEKTGRRPAWGILTGVRPVRLFRTVLAGCGGDEREARRIMAERYLVSPGKLELAAEIARRQRPLLEGIRPDGFSLYVSIPFCPSRCLYCSFISHDIAGARRLIPDYVRLLCEEIARTGELAARRGLRLRTVYIGGGTPTVLEAEQLERILEAVAKSFDCAGLPEYTVEAGRPDTITAEKLAAVRRLGAGRVSVNPQTMDDELLRAIGRNHTAAAVEEAFALAREAGFEAVNMDLIAGLPGETGAQFAATLDRVLAMRPENITVHTLTVKRSSRLREAENAFAAAADVAALVDGARQRLREAGYRPYYLYRQKGTVDNLENTGYALPGREGLYNVLIMEELQTILAVGAGAVSKLVLPGAALRRVCNHKYPHEYVARFDEILARKDEMEALLQNRGTGPVLSGSDHP